MAWSAYTNNVFLEFQDTFLKFREIYPQLHEVFDNNPKLIDDENALLSLYYLWKAGLITVENQNVAVVSKACEILKAGVKDPVILAASVLIMRCIKEYDRLTEHHCFNIFLNIPNFEALKIFVHTLIIIDESDVLTKQTFDRVFNVLATKSMELFVFQTFMEKSDAASLPIFERKQIWDNVIILAEKDKKLFYEFINILNYLDEFQGLTQARLKHYVEGLHLSFATESVSVHALGECIKTFKEQVILLDYLDVSEAIKDQLLDKVETIHQLCASGVSIDMLAEHYASLTCEVREKAFEGLNDMVVCVLQSLLDTKLIDPEVCVSLMTPASLALLEKVYREMVLQNISKQEVLFEKMANCLKDSASFERENTLCDFVANVHEFAWLDLQEPVREYMFDNRVKVLRVCQTGLSIEGFARMSFFHKRILPNMTSNTKNLLTAIFEKVSSRWYYLILMNATDLVSKIADELAWLNALSHNKVLVVDDMLSELFDVIKNEPEVPNAFVQFFKGYYARLQRYEICGLSAEVSELLQRDSCAMFELCSVDDFSFEDFLRQETSVQKQLLNLPANVSKLVIHLSGCFGQTVDDLVDQDYLSLPLFVDPVVLNHLHNLASVMRDDDSSEIVDQLYENVVTCFAEIMVEKELCHFEIVEALKRCHATLCSESGERQNSVVAAGLFRLASNDSDCMCMDERLLSSDSVDSSASFEF